MELLKTSDLCFLDHIWYPDMTFEEGKMSFLTGESGCGKSSLLKLLNGIIPPSSGTIYYKDTDIAQFDPLQLRREMILCAQEPWLFDGTILDNFKEYYEYQDLPFPDEEHLKCCLAVCCLKMGEASGIGLDTPCQRLSGGERARVFLAICLSFGSKVLFLDEPTAALDDQTAREFFEGLKKYATTHGITLLIICHSPNLVKEFGDAIFELKRGAK